MESTTGKSMDVDVVVKFEAKQGVELEEAVTTHNGTLFRFNDHYGYYLHEIKFDIETNQPVGRIKKWHDEQTDAAIEGIIPFQEYRDYCGSEE
jgi:serine protease inhibitor